MIPHTITTRPLWEGHNVSNTMGNNAGNNASKKLTGIPQGIGKEKNKPNMELMARAFINLYKEYGVEYKRAKAE